MFICERCGAETEQSEALQAGQEAKSAYPRCPRCGSCRLELKDQQAGWHKSLCTKCGREYAANTFLSSCLLCGGTCVDITYMGFSGSRECLKLAEETNALALLYKYSMGPAPATVSGLAINQEHYNAGGRIQPIEVMQSNMTPDRFLGFLQGNVIKYSMRAGRKDDEKKEVDKVIQYATWWRAALDGKTIDPRAK